MLVLDSGGFSRLAERSKRTLALIEEFRMAGLWPPIVPSVVLVESLHGHPGRDANSNRFLKTVVTDESIDVATARRAAELRRRAKTGSAVDAVVVAVAEPNGVVLTGDDADITALASHARRVTVELI
jgi:predicted nucleic acid-binding protein